MIGYTVTQTNNRWELRHSSYGKTRKLISIIGWLLLSAVFIVGFGCTIYYCLTTKQDIYFILALVFPFGAVAGVIISLLVGRDAIISARRWGSSLSFDKQSGDVDIFGKKSDISKIASVKFTYRITHTGKVRRARLYLISEGSEVTALDSIYDWFNNDEWMAIGTSLAGFVSVPFVVERMDDVKVDLPKENDA